MAPSNQQGKVDYETITAQKLLLQLANEGGYIVATSECHVMEIAFASAEGRMYVDESGLGFIRRPKDAVKPTFQ